MYNFCAKFRQILEICKRFSENLVNPLGNVPRVGIVPRFSNLEVVALSLTAEAFGIDSENCLFHWLSSCKDEIPNLISRRQYNDRRKLTSGLSEEIRNYAMNVDGLFKRIITKISAFTVLQYINKTNNKPIDQIKYALL